MGKKLKKKKNKFKKTKPLKRERKNEVIEDVQSEFHYKIGHTVVVKRGILDPEYGIEIEGWKGKIYDIENSNDPLLSIEWDNETLSKMPIHILKSCEKDNLDCRKMSLYASEVEPEMPDGKQANDKILLQTMTDDIFMLARLHYDLFDTEKIHLIFSKLRCMVYDTIQGRWVWQYMAEAKKLKFKRSYYKIPIERRPIILGSFFLKSDNKMYLNVNSFERAKKAVLFFDKFIPRTVAKVTDIDVLNKIFDSYDGNMPKHEDYFDKNPIRIIDPQKTIDEMKDITASAKNPHKKLKIALKHAEDNSKKPLSKIERFPINYYEDGILGLEGSLMMRETIALQHWSGKRDFTFYDLMQQVVPSNLKKS